MAPIPTNTEADEGGGGGRGSPAPDKNQYLLATTDEGEPCDPNNPTSCDSPFLECGWNARDMYYKCRFRKQRKKRPHPASRHFKEHKITKKPAPPTRPPSTTTAATTTPQMKTDEDIFNDDSMGPSPEGMEDNLDTISTTGLPVQMNQSTQESHQAKGIKVPSRLSDYYIRNGRQSGLGRLADAELGTYEVPPYEGALTWDGRAESSRECIPKHIMADNLQELRPLGDKKEYIESNKDMFCDFTKFFHCVLLKPDVDYNDLEEPDPTSENQGEGQPVCRCYDSSMPVFGTLLSLIFPEVLYTILRLLNFKSILWGEIRWSLLHPSKFWSQELLW